MTKLETGRLSSPVKASVGSCPDFGETEVQFRSCASSPRTRDARSPEESLERPLGKFRQRLFSREGYCLSRRLEFYTKTQSQPERGEPNKDKGRLIQSSA